MSIILVGMNHKTAPLTIRERLSLSCDSADVPLRKLKQISQISEALYLATCNRVEVLAHLEDREGGVEELKKFILSHGNLSLEELRSCLYVYRDDDAVRHLFRVASSLDSMIMGEPQILGQVKDAYRQCVEYKASGIILNKLLHHTFRVAKRVRTETGIANNAVSVSFAAVALAKKIFGFLAGKSVLVIGAGEMSELAARHLMANGVNRIIVANRTYENAVRLANDFHGEPIGLDLLDEKLNEVDIVISSTAAPGYVITPEVVVSALRRRKNRLMFMIDIAVPRDIDPAVGDIDNVYLYNIDNLQEIVDDNMKVRLKEAEKAETIITEEIIIFSNWLSTLEVVPTIVSLRRKAEDIIAGELERSGAWMKNLSDDDRDKVKIIASSIVNKILHDPITSLKEESLNGGADPYVAAIIRLFKLGHDE
ncbi:MAG TPA: glutamyl-tRNA reductase [Deltaproteobacteria bacterium]|nr:glutamyl-tRNA reductase [Deltaproteobacteria bacterium]